MQISGPYPGLGQFSDFLEPVGPMTTAGSTTTAALTANTVYLYRFRVQNAITLASARVYLGATVAGNGAIGIFTSDGTTWTRVAASADAAWSGTSAVSTIAFAAAYTCVPGVDYWVAFAGTDNTLTIWRCPSLPAGAIGAIGNRSISKAGVYSSGLPATITTPAGQAVPFWIGLTT